jgi:SAM-dependent methyltransferase
MGIMAPVARLILRDHIRRPFAGTGLLVGRQTVPLTPDSALKMLSQEGIEPRNIQIEIDKSTIAAQTKGYITDTSFFSLFSDIKISALDVTDYEGAEIVHDMHEPIPASLENKYDFVWNGSCLDNMFDPATAMMNTARMVRPGGRLICMEMGSPHFDAYTMYSQSWFNDYFAINNFSYCKVYSFVFRPNDIWTGPYQVFLPNNYKDASRLFPMMTFKDCALLTFAIAEKSENSTWDRKPIQWQYRPDHKLYQIAFANFTKLPSISLPKKKDRKIPFRRGFDYIGQLDGSGASQAERWARIARFSRRALRDPIGAASRIITKLKYRHYDV